MTADVTSVVLTLQEAQLECYFRMNITVRLRDLGFLVLNDVINNVQCLAIIWVSPMTDGALQEI